MKVFLLLLYSAMVVMAEPPIPTTVPASEIDNSLGDMGCLEGDLLKEPVEDEVKDMIHRGERDFSVNLIKSLFQSDNQTAEGEENNIFISPSSIYQTLTLSHFGARGRTKEALDKVMGIENITSIRVMKNYLFDKFFQAIRERNPDLGYKLNHANKFYFHRELPLDHCLQTVLGEDMEAVDFNNPSKVRRIINEWVEKKTEKKIKELLAPGSLDGSTRVALINAAYFKGEWESRFNETKTKEGNFYVRRDKISMVKFMEQKGKFNYYVSEELRAHVLELPYRGEDISMVLILPPFEKDSLKETISRLTPENLQGVMAEVKSGFYTMDDLSVKIPKFRIEQSFQLADTLGKIGLNSLFDASSDLSGFLSENTDEVKLQSAIHKSFIEVNEEGSEAAASTAIFAFRSARPLFHKNFHADHPFLFLIFDKQTDTILFFGVYQNPNSVVQSFSLH